MSSSLTFSDLESQSGFCDDSTEPVSSLTKWYKSVRRLPFTEFDDRDLCVSCRQQIFVDAIFPTVVARLEENTTAGDMYEGELIVAVASLPDIFWQTHRLYVNRLRPLLHNTRQKNTTKNVNDAIEKLISTFDRWGAE